MVVAITPNLKHLQDKLSDKGYKVVMLGQYDYPIDALIYTGYCPDVSFVCTNNVNNISNSGHYGVLMINAVNKSVEELDKILKTRLYSPLF